MASPIPDDKKFHKLLASAHKGDMTPEENDRMIAWVRCTGKDHKDFIHPDCREVDLRQLGLYSSTMKLNHNQVREASVFIFSDENQKRNPNYWELLRFLKDRKNYDQQKKYPIDEPYREMIGSLVDEGKTNMEIAYYLFNCKSDQLSHHVWGKCDRLIMGDKAMGNSLYKQKLAADINAKNPIDVFLPEAPHEIFARNGIMMKQTMQILGVYDKHWRWSEERFQKFLRLNNIAEQHGIPPKLGATLLWMNDWVDMKGKLLKKILPFDPLLGNCELTRQQIDEAKRLAGIFLREKKDDPFIELEGTITATQVLHIQKCLRWFEKVPNENSFLIPLMPLEVWICDGRSMNWKQFEKIALFINQHIKEEPNPELLDDYLYPGFSDLMIRAGLKCVNS